MQSNLQKRLGAVQAAVRELPGVAAGATEKLLQQGQAAQRAPDGSRWKKTTEGRPFDQAGHIRYTVAVRQGQVVLESDHPAAAFSRWGTRKMVARPKVPGVGGGAAWFPKILQALRRWQGRP